MLIVSMDSRIMLIKSYPSSHGLDVTSHRVMLLESFSSSHVRRVMLIELCPQIMLIKSRQIQRLRRTICWV